MHLLQNALALLFKFADGLFTLEPLFSHNTVECFTFWRTTHQTAYQHRTLDVTLAKFEIHQHHTYPNRQIKCSRTLSILQCADLLGPLLVQV